MDDDYEMAVNSNQMISGKSLTAKHVNPNDVAMLHHNALNASLKCNSKSTIMFPTTSINTAATANTSISSSSSSSLCNSPNIMLPGGNATFTTVGANMPPSLNSNDALHTRLTFTSSTLVNSRPAMGTNIAIDCYDTDTVDSSIIKEEPMSPDSSCPPSPIPSTSATSILDGSNGHIIVAQPTQQTGANPQFGTINVNLSNVASYTNTDLVFEHSKVNLCISFGFVACAHTHTHTAM